MDFPTHTVETAPEAARPLLAEAEKAAGFVPNLYGVMAEAPALLEGYRALSQIFEKTSLSPIERQIVLLAISAENGCAYCVAAHSMIAAKAGVAGEAIEAIRDGHAIAEPRLEALRRFVETLVRTRGWPADADVEAFLGGGFSRAQILEVILAVGYKTLSNYTNHLAHTPLDQAFAKARWSKAA